MAKSSAKSSSHNVCSRSSDENISPLKAKKHPRHSLSVSQQELDQGLGVSRQPSLVTSLISNEPPKRQRKYEDEASSRLLAGTGDTFEESTKGDVTNTAVAGKDVSDKDGEDNETVDEVGTNDDVKSKNNVGDSTEEALPAELQSKGSKGKYEGKHWKSSLVCADLSLNEVGSKIYGPLIASLRDVGVLGAPDEGPGDLENIMATYAVSNVETQQLSRTIYDIVEKVYIEEFGLGHVNIAQKALALVADAFNIIIEDYLTNE